jgi:hypothetical protein
LSQVSVFALLSQRLAHREAVAEARGKGGEQRLFGLVGRACLRFCDTHCHGRIV